MGKTRGEDLGRESCLGIAIVQLEDDPQSSDIDSSEHDLRALYGFTLVTNIIEKSEDPKKASRIAGLCTCTQRRSG